MTLSKMQKPYNVDCLGGVWGPTFVSNGAQLARILKIICLLAESSGEKGIGSRHLNPSL